MHTQKNVAHIKIENYLTFCTMLTALLWNRFCTFKLINLSRQALQSHPSRLKTDLKLAPKNVERTQKNIAFCPSLPRTRSTPSKCRIILPLILGKHLGFLANRGLSPRLDSIYRCQSWLIKWLTTQLQDVLIPEHPWNTWYPAINTCFRWEGVQFMTQFGQTDRRPRKRI